MTTAEQKKEEAAKRSLSTEEVIVLDGTIDIGGVKTNRVTMRRPKVRDRLVVERDATFDSEADRELRYICNLTGLVPEDIEDLWMTDYNKLVKQLRLFQSGQQ